MRTTPWTPDELALIETERRRWLAIGRSTDRADIPATQAAWAALYRRAGLVPVFTWVTSGPLAAHAAMALWKRASLGDSLRASLDDSLRATLIASLIFSLEGSVDISLRDDLRASMGDSLRASMGDSLRASLDDSLRDSLRASLAVKYCWTWFWGAHDAFWIGWYRTAQRLGVVFTAEQEDQLREFELLSQSALWSWPYERGVVACDRPTVCVMEEERPMFWRLHHPTGPALAFADGYELYAWHGITVQGEAIRQPQRITPESITAEPNAERRRALIEIMGWDRWLSLSGATPIAQDRFGQLYRTELNGARIGVVVVENSTVERDGSRKKYALIGDAAHESAHALVAASFGLTPETYQPVVET